MPYRTRSTDLWHSLPGVVAAYQPIAAPDPFAARQNVAHGGARFGVYTATTPATPLTWSKSRGWGLGAGKYLKTGVVPVVGYSMIVRYINANNVIAGSMTTWGVAECNLWPAAAGQVYWSHGNEFGAAPGMVSGILCVAGTNGFRNGTWNATGGSSSWTSTRDIYIGCQNEAGTPSSFSTIGNIQSFLLANRTFSFAEVWLASRQMAYCEQNPDWNAWARRRRYYYAPSAASGFQAAWAARQNRLIGGGLS